MSALEWEPSPDAARRWTADEDAVMRADYHTAGVVAVARRLNRTEGAIRQHAVKMGIARSHPSRLRMLEDQRAVGGQIRRARILLAFHMRLLSAAEASHALAIPEQRLLVECAKDAYLGQAEAGPGPALGRWAAQGEE